MKQAKLIGAVGGAMILVLGLGFAVLRLGSSDNTNTNTSTPDVNDPPKPASALAKARTTDEPVESLTQEEREQRQERRTDMMEQFSKMSDEERKQFIARQAVPGKRPSSPQQQARIELQKKWQTMTASERKILLEKIVREREARSRPRDLPRDVNEPSDANQTDS